MASTYSETHRYPTQREVAAHLGISTGTACYHVRHLLDRGDLSPARPLPDRVLDHVITQAVIYGVNPTTSTIAAALNIAATTARAHVNALADSGEIDWGPGHPHRLISPRGDRFRTDCETLLHHLRTSTTLHDAIRTKASHLALAVLQPPEEIHSRYRPDAAAAAIQHLTYRHGRPATTTEVGHLLDWPKPTAHKTLHAAAAQGLVRPDARSGYDSPRQDMVYTNAFHLRNMLARHKSTGPARDVLQRVLNRVIPA